MSRWRVRLKPADGPCEFSETCYMVPSKCRGTQPEAAECESRTRHIRCVPRVEMQHGLQGTGR